MEKQLLLLLLITVLVHKSDQAIEWEYYVIVDDNDKLLPMTWSEAREECRSDNSDMFTLDLVTESTLKSITEGMDVVWMGLTRDKQNDSAWHWDTTIVTPTKGDISQTLNWSEGGHCALLNSDSTWSSRKCDEKQPFFCSFGEGITYRSTKLSWRDARESCQNDNGELAIKMTENTGDDGDDSDHEKKGWIGLYRVGGDSWGGAGGESVGVSAWGPGEPVTNDCGAYDEDKEKWESHPCDARLNVVCYEDNLVVVTESKTWEEAMEHCKTVKPDCTSGTCLIQYKLLTVESPSDYDYVRKRISGATTDEVWTGLRFLGGQWFFVDGKPVNDEGKLPKCPVYGEHCGVVSKTDDTPWLTADCSEKLNFVCYKETVSSTVPAPK